MANLSLSKLTLVTALVAVCLFLVVAFFLVYFTDDGPQPIELTTGSPASTPQVPVLGTKEASSSEKVQPESAASKGSTQKFRVYIAGAVRRPGVYTMQSGDRLIDVVEAARGATAIADLEAVNLAVRVEDEEYYYIPNKVAKHATDAKPHTHDPTESPSRFPPLAADLSTGELPEDSTKEPGQTGAGDALVNLNTADQAKLETLPGIGPVRTQAIIAHRDQNGPFPSVEEITAVHGIGPGILENLRHLATVDP